jgi:hypothetical protein
MAIKKIQAAAGLTEEVKDQFLWSETNSAIRINKVMCMPGLNLLNDEDPISPSLLAIHFGAHGYVGDFPNPTSDGFRARVARVPDVYFQSASGTYQAWGADEWVDVNVTIPTEDLVVGVRNTATVIGIILIDYDIISLSETDATLSRFS